MHDLLNSFIFSIHLATTIAFYSQLFVFSMWLIHKTDPREV